MKLLFSLILVLAANIQMGAAPRETAYNALEEKASRFYAQHDWSSASAMYDLMLSQRPQETATYCKAITAAGMRDNKQEEMRLLSDALSARIPIDSLLSGIRSESFALGQSDMYEQFLLAAKADKSWLRRSIDSYLLKYYAFRRNGGKIIEYAKTMLAGNPDDTNFAYQLAQGLLIDGRTNEAMEIYHEIVNADPEAFDAMVYLGNHYAAQGDSTQALEMFKRAYAVKRTPHVAACIKKLTESQNL